MKHAVPWLGQRIATAWRYVYELNNDLAEAIANITAWRIWMNVVALGTVGWILADRLIEHRFDPQSAGLTLLMLVLTIQTSLDAQGQRHSQRVQRDIEKKRDAQFFTQLGSISDLTVQIREALDRLFEGDEQALERDRQALERDLVIRNLIVRLLDAVEDAGVAVNNAEEVKALEP